MITRHSPYAPLESADANANPGNNCTKKADASVNADDLCGCHIRR